MMPNVYFIYSKYLPREQIIVHFAEVVENWKKIRKCTEWPQIDIEH